MDDARIINASRVKAIAIILAESQAESSGVCRPVVQDVPGQVVRYLKGGKNKGLW